MRGIDIRPSCRRFSRQQEQKRLSTAKKIVRTIFGENGLDLAAIVE